MTTPAVLTIGHSTHALETFLGLLEQHAVDAIADVRSAPYSRFQPHFNREPLEQALKDHGIAYVFVGRELGARSEDRSCYDGGRIQYARLAKTALFQAGVDRVVDGAESYRMALMCAEKEPLECHRTFLVGRELEARGLDVAHIHADGHLESTAEAMTRLLRILKMPETDLFKSQDELIADACARQEHRIAHVDPDLREASREGSR